MRPKFGNGIYLFPEGTYVPLTGAHLGEPRFSHRLPYGGQLPDGTIMLTHAGVAKLKQGFMLEITEVASFVNGIWRVGTVSEHDTSSPDKCGYTECYLHRVDNLEAFEIADNYRKALTKLRKIATL